MVLVDTSVIIDYLRNVENRPVVMLQYILDNNIPFGINSFIFLEVLQGAKSEKDFEKTKRYLGTQKFYGLKDPIESYAGAARIYFACRRKGITVRSSVDCLVAQTAIENNLFLLHNDSDFDRIAAVAGLKFFNV